MRGVPMLATLALVDVLLVSIAGLEPARVDAGNELRAQLAGTIAFAGAGCVALAALSFATRWVARHRHDGVRLLSGLVVGALYALGLLGFAAWTYLWMTPTHFPVAIVCGASALLLVWQAVGASQPEERER